MPDKYKSTLIGFLATLRSFGHFTPILGTFQKMSGATLADICVLIQPLLENWYSSACRRAAGQCFILKGDILPLVKHISCIFDEHHRGFQAARRHSAASDCVCVCVCSVQTLQPSSLRLTPPPIGRTYWLRVG